MYEKNDQYIISILVVAIILVFIILIFLVNIYIYHQRNKKLYLINIKAEMNAKEDERKRISNDLHDELGVSLSAIKMQIQALTPISDKESQLIEKISDNISDTVKSIRFIMNDLYPTSLEKFGLALSINELIENINSTNSISIIFLNEIPDIDNIIRKEYKIHVFRIIKEIINNTIKHSKSNILSIKLVQTENQIIIESLDQGIGLSNIDQKFETMEKGYVVLLIERNLWEALYI